MPLPFDIPMPSELKLDRQAMAEDLAMARKSLMAAHVKCAPNMADALFAMHACFAEEARLILTVLYRGDMELVRDHERRVHRL